MVRPATSDDMESVYMMGFDVWGEAGNQIGYLEQCHTSPKYKRGQWYVLCDTQGKTISSLISYNLSVGVFGIGSIATLPTLRRQGLAKHLIQVVLSILNREGAKTIYLFSDIKPDYYEKLGFVRLPTDFQNHKDSICMVRGTPVQELTRQPGFAPPSYF